MHQPLPLPVDESSTEQNVAGGTLTSTPIDKFLSSQYSTVMNVDQLVELPFFVGILDYNIATPYNVVLYQEDPFFKGRRYSSTQNLPVPWPIVALRGCHFYDMDIEISFLAIKHERGRGRLQFDWKGFGFYKEIRTNGGIILTSVDTAGIHTRGQKWIWDIEANDTFTITIQAPKLTAWRSRRILDEHLGPTQNFPDVYPKHYDSPTMKSLAKTGDLTCRVLDPYNGGMVGPDSCPVIVFYKFVNLKTAEFRPPWSLSRLDEDDYM